MNEWDVTRYEIENRGGRLYVVGDDDSVEIGDLDDVVATIGGETYTITYDGAQRAQPWLDTDDGDLEIDVREAVTSIRFRQETFDAFADAPMDDAKYGIPERVVDFADVVVDIWEEQGEDR